MNLSRFSTQTIKHNAVPYQKCLAKTFKDENGISHPSFSVEEHSRIVGKIAEALLQLQPEQIKKLLPQYEIWPALIHDIGKISPSFQKKLSNTHPSLEKHPVLPEHETLWGGHAWVSAATILQESSSDNAKQLACIVGQHHGKYKANYCYTSTHESLGGEHWHQERVKLMLHLAKQFFNIDTLPEMKLSEFAIRFLSGLTTVADWIGSGKYFDKMPYSNWDNNISLAVQKAGFISHNLEHGLSFEKIFGFKPRSIQENLYKEVTGPGLYILEAPMGLGKTEAALYAAYKILDTKQASGIYFALPTQLTSEKIHQRLAQFLHAIYPDDDSTSAYLLHGKAWLRNNDISVHEEGGTSDTSWFSSKKRGLLAPFAAGTVDQALMSVINVKHAAVRAFALTGKVVILDELHSYDIYTGTLIDSLIEFLLEANCTIIILSATLTKERRASILPHSIDKARLGHSYPLISAYSKTKNCFKEIISDVPKESHRRVHLNWSSDINACVDSAIKYALEGEQVLWIENTVTDAQKLYLQIAAKTLYHKNIELGLLHSRFTPEDRQSKEDHWISLYGKDSSLRSLQGRILVGTQVVEQSIDIDADRLITRLCPSDMLFQRFGRLHRHQNKRPANNQCHATIIAPTQETIKRKQEHAFERSRFVYDPYVLMRTLEAWNQVNEVSLPDDIRPILEKTYTTRDERGEMLRLYVQLENRVEDLRKLALHSTSQSHSAMSDETASTRMNDTPQVDLLLIKSYHVRKTEVSLTLLDGEEVRIPLDRPLLQYALINILRKLMKNVVKIPEHLAPSTLTALHDSLSMLSYSIHTYAVLGEDSIIKPDSEKYSLSYTSHLGFVANKK